MTDRDRFALYLSHLAIAGDLATDQRLARQALARGARRRGNTFHLETP